MGCFCWHSCYSFVVCKCGFCRGLVGTVDVSVTQWNHLEINIFVALLTVLYKVMVVVVVVTQCDVC